MRTVLRWLFAALVLANVGVAMWANWYREPAAPPSALSLPEIHPERMILLSLPQLKPVPPLTPASAKPGPPPHAVANTDTAHARQCLTIGPFGAMSKALRAGAWLKAAGIAYGTHTQVDKVVSSYWVYLPPRASLSAAKRMLRELDRKGIRNHIIMQQPGLDNAISLGLYDLPDNAHARMVELAKKGVHANQQVHYRLRTRYWLDLEVGEASERTRLQSRDWGAAGVAVQETSCAAVPTPSVSPVLKATPKSVPFPQTPVPDRAAPEQHTSAAAR